MQLSDRARRALFGEPAFHTKTAVIFDCAVHVELFGRTPCWAWWRVMCVSIFGNRSFSCVFAVGQSRLFGRQFLLMLSSLPYFSYLSSWDQQIEDVSEIAARHHERSFWGWGCSSRLVRWLWTIWSIGSLLLCRQMWKTVFLLLAADGIAVLAVFWTYHRPDVLLVMCIDGRICWQSSFGLGRPCHRTSWPCWSSCAVFCHLGH